MRASARRGKKCPRRRSSSRTARTCRSKRCGERRRARHMKSICSAAWLRPSTPHAPTRSKAKPCSAPCSSRCRRRRAELLRAARTRCRARRVRQRRVLREQALKLVQHRFVQGEISELDVVRAKAELATARSDALAVERLRARRAQPCGIARQNAREFSMPANPLTAVDLRIQPACRLRCLSAAPTSRRQSVRWPLPTRASA